MLEALRKSTITSEYPVSDFDHGTFQERIRNIDHVTTTISLLRVATK